MRELKQGTIINPTPDPEFQSVCIHGLYPSWCAVCSLRGEDRKWLGRASSGARGGRGAAGSLDSRPTAQKIYVR